MDTFELPWPPSTNHYYRMHRGKILISADGRAYRQQIAKQAMVDDWPTYGTARLQVQLDVYPPDRRRRDLANIEKCLIDSLEHNGLFVNDEQIDDLRIIRKEVVPGGKITVHIAELFNN